MDSRTLTRGELNDLLVEKGMKSEHYLRCLREDPKRVIELQLNTKLADSLQVKVIEDTASTMYVVLPYQPKDGEELTDAQLEAVSGGYMDTYKCTIQKAGFGTKVDIHTSLW